MTALLLSFDIYRSYRASVPSTEIPAKRLEKPHGYDGGNKSDPVRNDPKL